MRMMHLVAAACLVLTGDAAHLTEMCEPPPPLCEAAARADLVFFGEVLEKTTYVEYTETGPLPQGVQAVRFNVIEPFKGVNGSLLSGFFYFGVESRSFKQGAGYLVFAHRRATGAFVTGCTLTREMTTESMGVVPDRSRTTQCMFQSSTLGKSWTSRASMLRSVPRGRWCRNVRSRLGTPRQSVLVGQLHQQRAAPRPRLLQMRKLADRFR